jgi:hypothetical protein
MASVYIRDWFLQNMMHIKLNKLEIPLSLINTLVGQVVSRRPKSLEKIWKEVIDVPWHLPRGNWENHKKSSMIAEILPGTTCMQVWSVSPMSSHSVAKPSK